MTELFFKNNGKRLLAFLIHVFEKLCPLSRKIVDRSQGAEKQPGSLSLTITKKVIGTTHLADHRKVQTRKYEHVQPNFAPPKNTLDYESSFQKAPILLVVILNKCPGAHSSKYAICFFQNLLSLSAVNVEGQISSQVKPVINRPGLT